MTDTECVRLLQWALPHLGLRWRGFRKVRGQVCKRIERRMRTLGMREPPAYMAYLDAHADEWTVLDRLCTISISRSYRDHRVFDALGDTVLPALAARATMRADTSVRCWSAGCASGEEPYILSLIWAERLRLQFPQAVLAVVATDIDDTLLERARVACYPRSSLRELPPTWIDTAFVRQNDEYCLYDSWKACVEFRLQDVRTDSPAGPFDLVLCRSFHGWPRHSRPMAFWLSGGASRCHQGHRSCAIRQGWASIGDVPPQTAEALDGGVHAVSRRREPFVRGNPRVEQ